MTTRKKSFLLHIDSLDILDDLSVNQAGLLFKAIKAYQNDEVIEVDEIVKLVFSPFKNQFKRDDEKYNKTCERRAIAGSKGGKQKVANASKCKQELANVADKKNKNKNKTNNDSKSDSKDIVTPTKKHSFSEVDYQCAEWFYSLVIITAPKSKRPNLEKWASVIRLMREVDNISHDEISNVFTWANKDSFWASNILSPDKLRKQFPQLQAKMKGANNGQSQSNGKKLSAYERARAANA